MKFCINKSSAVLAVLLAGAAQSALAIVTQTTPLASADAYNYQGPAVLGTVTFEAGTNQIVGLTSSMDIVDQGWGGQDPSNGVVINVYKDSNLIWGQLVAGASHSMTTQTFDISTQPASLSSLNSAMAAIDWSSAPTVTMSMQTSQWPYPGWAVHAQNATFSVSSVPEPSTYAMLISGLGVIGAVSARRRSC